MKYAGDFPLPSIRFGFRAKTITQIVFSLLIFSYFSSQKLHCQSLGMPAPGYKSTLGSAASTGLFFNKDAYFWGLGVDYSRLLTSKWVVNISLGYDQEISNSDNKYNNTIINTLTPSLAFGFILNSRIALGLGLGKGLFDDDNETSHLKLNTNGSYTLGLIGVYTIYQKGPHSFDITSGLEKELGGSDLDVTLEIGYGYSF